MNIENRVAERMLSYNFNREENKKKLLLQEKFINKLTLMQEDIQPLLFNTERPVREVFVQRLNFLYALIYKIKNDFHSAQSVLNYVNQLESRYPLATQTVNDVKRMPELQAPTTKVKLNKKGLF